MPMIDGIKLRRFRHLLFSGTLIFMMIMIGYDLSSKILSIIKICVQNDQAALM